MRRLTIMVIAMILASTAVAGDIQADFNRHYKAYNSDMAAGKYLDAAREAAATAEACGEIKNYDGAFKILSEAEQRIGAARVSADSMPAPYYVTAKARFTLYGKMKNNAQAEKWLTRMSELASKSGSRDINADVLFSQAQYYYSIDNDDAANRCISRLIRQFDSSKDYEGADKAYHQLIQRAVSAGNAEMVEHTYESYMKWSDSIEALTAGSELAKVKQEYAESQAEVAQKEHSVKARTATMMTFVTLFVIALAALAVGAMFYLRVIKKNRAMHRAVEEADRRNAAKSAMLGNMSARMDPTLRQLDPENPAVQSLRRYVDRVGELSEVENATPADESQVENTNLEPFCEAIAAEIRPQLRPGVSLVMSGTRGYASINAPEVKKILTHLLENAAKYTPDGGKIVLEYKKRGAHSHQFIVTDSGPGIPAERRETLFTAFADNNADLSSGDGLGLPICAVRAEKINGTLTLDPDRRSGSSFILTIHS